jgi:glycosyl transferase family 87
VKRWLLTLCGSWAVTLLVFPWSDERVSDLPVYVSNAAQFLDGKLPYRDVPFEYPPLAAPLMALPGTTSDYRLAFALLMLAFGAAVLLLVRALARATGGDERFAMAAVALAPLLTAAMIRNHFDLAPVALTLAALVLIARDRPALGMGVLGVAVATKGFPVVVAPVALAWLLARGRRADALSGTVALAAVVAVAVGASVAVSSSGSLDALHWQTARPVQVESIPGVALRAIGGAEVVHSYRSDGLVHPAGAALSGIVGALGAAAVVLLAIGVARRPGRRELVLASLGAVAAFASFGKVISPQYLVWTLPLAALALAWRRLGLFATLAGATLLTSIEFPLNYFSVVDGDPAAVALVGVRDALLVAAVALCVRQLYAPAADAGVSASRARATTSSPWSPGPQPADPMAARGPSASAVPSSEAIRSAAEASLPGQTSASRRPL